MNLQKFPRHPLTFGRTPIQPLRRQSVEQRDVLQGKTGTLERHRVELASKTARLKKPVRKRTARWAACGHSYIPW